MCRQEIARLKEQHPEMDHRTAFSQAADSVKSLSPLVLHQAFAAVLLLAMLTDAAQHVCWLDARQGV